MKDLIYIGSVPSGEACLGVGHPHGKRETIVFRNMLSRLFPEAKLSVKAEHHDFGTYYEVVAHFDDESDEEEENALDVESQCPEYWDDEAWKELSETIPDYPYSKQ